MLLLLYCSDLLHQISTFCSAVSILCIGFLRSSQLLYLQFSSTLALHRRVFEIIGRLRDDEFPEAGLVFDCLFVLGLRRGFLLDQAICDASWAGQIVILSALVFSQCCIEHSCAFRHTQAIGSIVARSFPSNLPWNVERSS